MSDPINPVQIETAIRETANRIAKGVRVCDERYLTFLTAAHALDVAYAHAYLGHDGPAHEKRYVAELATQSERAARDVADAAYRYADRQAKALDLELRAWQSIGASIRVQYTVAGRGEA